MAAQVCSLSNIYAHSKPLYLKRTEERLWFIGSVNETELSGALGLFLASLWTPHIYLDLDQVLCHHSSPNGAIMSH